MVSFSYLQLLGFLNGLFYPNFAHDPSLPYLIIYGGMIQGYNQYHDINFVAQNVMHLPPLPRTPTVIYPIRQRTNKIILTHDMPMSSIHHATWRRHETLPFLKTYMRHGDPPIKGPYHGLRYTSPSVG